MRYLGAIAIAIFSLPMISSAEGDARIVHKQLTIAGTNDEWTNTTVKVDSGNVVLIFAQGQVTIASDEVVGPDGRQNVSYLSAPTNTPMTGMLVAKIGTGTMFTIGKNASFIAQRSGTLKLRVHDTNYNDNGGSFEVNLIYLPTGALPPADVVAEAE
jgi:hypothetical protein